MGTNKIARWLAGVALAAVAPAMAHAQDTASSARPQASDGQSTATPPSNPDIGVGEIVVTAQKRSENLQRVPIAISAVTAEALTNKGIRGLDNIQLAVPSLSIQSANGYLALHLRGVGTIANGPGFENPIALYVDGVYYANQSVGLAQFNNIERVEVLKGPQGTLFGRNATGGLVSVITKDPGQRAELAGTIGYGNYNTVDAQLYAATPFTDNLSSDVALHFGRHDGYGTNLFNGKDVYKSKHDIAVRSKTVWKPGDLKFTLIGDYTDRRDSSNALTDIEGSLTLPTAPRVKYPNAWDANLNTQPALHIRGEGVSLKAEAPLGSISVSNLAAYRASLFDNNFDFDGSAFPITAPHIHQKDWQFSDEVQFSSKNGDRFTWTAGAFYFKAQGKMAPLDVNFGNDPVYSPGYPIATVRIQARQNTEALAGYAQGTFKLTDTLGLTGGVRYSWERRSINGREDGILVAAAGGATIPLLPTTVAHTSFRKPTFRAAIDWQAQPHLLLYASFNTGFKSGGYNATTPDAPPYKPEKITAYEIGEKWDFFDRKVRLNSAAFYYKYDDLQVQVAQQVGTGFTNGAAARIYGFDSDLTIVPVRDLQFNAGVSVLHATYRSFPNAPVGVPGGGFPVGTGNVSGNDLAYAPPFVVNAGATYTAHLDHHDLVMNASWLHSSHFYHEADNVVREPAYDQVNATATLKLGHYSIGVYGTNLLNEAIRSVVLTIPSGQEIQLLQPPRTYGVRFGFNF